MKERTGTVNCMIATIIICIIAELIGPLQFKVMGIGREDIDDDLGYHHGNSFISNIIRKSDSPTEEIY